MKPDDLDAATLILAYQQGIFPMPDPDSGEIQFYQPHMRAIIPLAGFHVSRSLRKKISKAEYFVKTDSNFSAVMQQCANRPETWITEAFFRAYGELHRAGCAHSLEIYQSDALVGGVYGVTLGSAFFAESMFHTVSNMSKIALYHLVCHLRERDFQMLECQFLTEHLASLGAIEISNESYLSRLDECLATAPRTF